MAYKKKPPTFKFKAKYKKKTTIGILSTLIRILR